MANAEATETPAAVEQAATTRANLPDRAVTLIGLFTGPEGARALLRDGGGDFTMVKIGDKVGRATVAAIDSGSLILAQGQDTVRLGVAEGTSSGRVRKVMR